MKTYERVSVGLGDRAYDIIIGSGALDEAGALLAPQLSRLRTVVVTDENVFAAQGKRLADSLSAAGIVAQTVILKPGEATKSFDGLATLVGRLIDLGVERSDLIIAFGGGVVGDLAGFAASIVKRGCRYAQIPTSLLAQVDSAIGGKTAINVAQGKNLVGAFHQPSIVISDIDVLNTLPARELRAGYAEIVKYGALGDPAFFGWLEKNGRLVLAGDAKARAYAVKRSCEMKAAIVARDERESGARALLNLGHTFGHALEAALGFSDRLLHGEAVAAGMGLAFEFSAREGLCPPDDAARLKVHLRAAGLPADISDIADAAGVAPERLLDLMRADKKAKAGAMTLILARGLGKAFIAANASEDAVLAFLRGKSAGDPAIEGRNDRH
ncbi:MAG: 3-dehydroquinate synthase [Parvularculaceae bacterium]